VARHNVPGTVYLLHFNEPFGHARHYCGWTENVPNRLAAHTAARGARLVRHVQAAGIGFVVARMWEGTRARERQLKRQGGASRRCPICRQERRRRGSEDGRP
jgi:predicted GIY-YIG superfamily endonuclease